MSLQKHPVCLLFLLAAIVFPPLLLAPSSALATLAQDFHPSIPRARPCLSRALLLQALVVQLLSQRLDHKLRRLATPSTVRHPNRPSLLSTRFVEKYRVVDEASSKVTAHLRQVSIDWKAMRAARVSSAHHSLPTLVDPIMDESVVVFLLFSVYIFIHTIPLLHHVNENKNV